MALRTLLRQKKLHIRLPRWKGSDIDDEDLFCLLHVVLLFGREEKHVRCCRFIVDVLETRTLVIADHSTSRVLDDFVLTKFFLGCCGAFFTRFEGAITWS